MVTEYFTIFPDRLLEMPLFFFEKDLFIYIFLFWGHCAGSLMLHGLSLVAVLTVVASLVAKHGL